VQREGASPELAAELLEAVFRADVTELLPRIEAPTLVVHRRNDRAMPFALGRELAAVIPGARLVALDGDVHMPWLGDGRSVLDAVLPFLRGGEAAAGRAEEGPLPFLRGGEAAAGPAGAEEGPLPSLRGAEAGPLTDREREVLRLVAEGLSDGEIAERLVLSPHTVHRHVANIRTKLRQPSRAAAAAHAARLGLI
jgi:DNA-binding CsgD family transcriptional regulator